MMLMGFIQFVQPALLAAAAGAVLIPLMIHLINRRRFKRVPWAAMTFLLAAAKRSARRIQLEQWSLLALRMLLILVLGLLLARPYFRQEALAAISGSRAHHVLILDNSASMAARRSDPGVAGATRTEFDRAKQIALDLLRTLSEQDSISIIAASNPASGVLAYECFDHRLAQDQVQSLKPTYRNNDLAGALTLAERLVAESSAALGNRIVYVISDHARHTWKLKSAGNALIDTASPSASNGTSNAEPGRGPSGAQDALAVASARRLANAARLLLIRTTPYATAVNVGPVALTGLDSPTSLSAVNLPLGFEVEMTNYSPASTGSAVIEVKRDGQVIKEVATEALGSGETGTASFSLAIAQPGSHALELRLSGQDDLLPEAAVRRAGLDLPREIPVLLVDSNPGISLLAGHSGYVATALAAYTARDGAPLFETKVVGDNEAQNEVLGDYNLVVLAGVGQVAESLAARLSTYVEEGGAVLVFMGDGVVPARYNELLYADGKGWFPARIDEFVGESAMEFPGRPLLRPDRPHPLVADFANLDQSGLFQARFRKYARLTPDQASSPSSTESALDASVLNAARRYPAEVVLTLDNGDPLLVVRRFGQGRSAVFASTANMEWCNLPAKGDFVSLMINLVAFLCPPSGAGRTLEAGQPFRESLPPSETGSGYELLSPSQQSVTADVDCDDRRCELTSDPLDEPGFYRFRSASRLEWVAVNFPAAEADLRPLSPGDAEAVLGDQAEWIDDAGELMRRLARGRTTEIGGPLLFVLIGLLVTEGWLAMRYGLHR